MIRIHADGANTPEITIRNTPNDEDAILELAQETFDFDGLELSNAIAVSMQQAKSLHEALGLILSTVDEDTNDRLNDLLDDFLGDDDPFAGEPDDELEIELVTVTVIHR